MWAGRAVLWALIIVILVNGVRAPFERFTADDSASGGGATAAKPPKSAAFPSSAAGAFALQFANVYLNFDQKNAPAREAQLRTFLPDGADAQFGWNGVGKMAVQSVQVAGVDARDAHNATVTLLARTADRWLRLAVPVYADKSGSWSCPPVPPCFPADQGAASQGGVGDRDTPLENELKPFLGTFFQEYATGNQEALSRFSDGTTIAYFANSVTFVQVKEVVAPKGPTASAPSPRRWCGDYRGRRRRTGADLSARHGQEGHLARAQHSRHHRTERVMRGRELNNPTPIPPTKEGSQSMLHHLMASIPHEILAAPNDELKTDQLADWLRQIFGPLFLVIVSIVAIFFLFTREITRFVQFIVLAIGIGVVFYVPNIIETTAKAIAKALGVDVS